MRLVRPPKYLAILLLWSLLLPLLAAQSGDSSAQNSRQGEPLETLRVDVNVVNVFFNVKNKKGLLISDLTRDAFVITEDEKPQTIKYFSAEANQPLTLGLLIDTSPSQMRVLGMEQQVAAEFIRQILREKDLAFLINFDVSVDLQQDFTSNARDLRRSLDELRVRSGGPSGGPPGIGGGPLPPSGNPKGTLLYDAVFLAADEKLKTEVGRKAMIIFTDGQDQGSRTTIKEAIEAAQKSDAMCYVLIVADPEFYGQGGGYYGGTGPMKKLAEQTGGRLIEVGDDQEKLRKAFDQISNELRTQYNIGYTPTNQKKDGVFREVEIKTKDKNYKVQARAGYYAPSK